MLGMEPVYEVVWPQSPMAVQPRRGAPRLPDLHDATVAFLWDYVFRGDELFPVLADELRSRHPGLTVVPYDVVGNTHGGNEAEVIEALPATLRDRGVDAVVSGMGC